jgi:hypothetical protein
MSNSTKTITLSINNSNYTEFEIIKQVGVFTSDEMSWIKECLRQSVNAYKYKGGTRIETFDFDSKIFKNMGFKKMQEFLSKN